MTQLLRFFIVSFIVLLLLPASLFAEEVLVVSWRGMTMAEKAFVARLKDLRPNVKFHYIDAQRNKNRLETILRGHNWMSYDLVYTFGTTGARTVQSVIKKRIPHVFNFVASPVQSNIVNSMGRPGHNITGARGVIDIKTQFEFLTQLKKIKTLGIWFDPREPQSTLLQSQMAALAQQQGIDVKTFRVIPDTKPAYFKRRLQKDLASSNQLDLLYLAPTSSFFKMIKKHKLRFKPSLPVFSVVSQYVGKGVTISLAASFRERGITAAEIANKILSGVPADTIPVNQITMKNVNLYVDPIRAKAAKLGNLSRFGVRIVERTGKQ